MRTVRHVGTLFLLAAMFGPHEHSNGFAAAQRTITDADLKRIEITEKDLFASPNWDGNNVDVLGFRLAMTRPEANANAKRHNLLLVDPDLRNLAECSKNECEVCNSRSICPGITLAFGAEDEINRIDITRIPSDAATAVKKVAVDRQFKGDTYLFFHQYSNDLRLRLFGPEGSREVLSKKNPSYQGKVRYEYPLRGLTIFVSANPHGPERTSDLVISFVPPEKPLRN